MKKGPKGDKQQKQNETADLSKVFTDALFHKDGEQLKVIVSGRLI